MTLRNRLLATAITLAISPLAPVAFAADGGSDDPQFQHIVVIFQEYVSFDHYFGTYPRTSF